MGNHIISKLAADGGPSPEAEVSSIVARSAAHNSGLAWFGTRKAGASFALKTNSYAVCFFPVEGGTIDGFVGRIIERVTTMPSDAEVRELYGESGPAMTAWWRVRHVRRLKPGTTLASIPGSSVAGLSAAAAFKGQGSFAYWRFDDPLAAYESLTTA